MRPFLQTTTTISTASPLKRSAPTILLQAAVSNQRLRQQALFSTRGAPVQESSAGGVLKSTAKAIDNAAATAALKGIEVGEKVATKTRETIGRDKTAPGSDSSLPGVDMYGEQDARPEGSFVEAPGRVTASTVKKATEEGTQLGRDVGEAAAKAKQKAGEKAGKVAEEVGRA